MFVAQGMLGRTVISCDDGHTWVADRSWVEEADPLLCGSTDPVRCFESSCQFLNGGECTLSADCDCGHHPGFSKGIAYGNGYFVATWGWGFSGSVRRSTDGVRWEETLTEDVTFGGLAFGGGRFVLSSRNPQHSLDGATWTLGDEADFRGPNGEITWSVRAFGFSDFDGGRFIATANPPQSVLVSSDGGASWWAPTDAPEDCLADVGSSGGIASGGDVIVGVGANGSVCSSRDGGDTWALDSVGGDDVRGHLIWTGTQFITWGPGVAYASPAGTDWQATPTAPAGVGVGPAAYNPQTGTYVAVSGVWQAYESQRFLRSADGVAWDELPAGAAARGHNVFDIAFGYAAASDVCPGA